MEVFIESHNEAINIQELDMMITFKFDKKDLERFSKGSCGYRPVEYPNITFTFRYRDKLKWWEEYESC